MRLSGQFDIPLRTQQFVLAAAETGSFHKAAKTMGVDPAVVVRSIDKLERDLGVKIFERSRNRFNITQPGSYFIQEIRDAVVHIERARDFARFYARLERGPLRVGYSPLIQADVVPGLEDLKRAEVILGQRIENSADDLETGVVIECDTTVQLVNRLQRGEFHIALGISPLQEENLSIKPIAREPFCLCISKNHRLAKQSTVLAREMDGETVFFLPRAIHPAFYDRTIEYVESTGCKSTLREVLSFAHAMEIVARNFGIALLPHSTSRLSHAGVLFKTITDKLLWIETALFVRREDRRGETQEFLHKLLNQLHTRHPDK